LREAKAALEKATDPGAASKSTITEMATTGSEFKLHCIKQKYLTKENKEQRM